MDIGGKTMKHPFNTLTGRDVEILRRKQAYGHANYHFDIWQLQYARAHLQTLYPNCTVQMKFAASVLLLNELF